MTEADQSPSTGSLAYAKAGGLIGLLTASCRHIALLAAMIATCGSLFFSQVLLWPPCELCWYQRIIMYPLTIILGVGILKRDTTLHWYGLPLSLLGMCVSAYHYLEVLHIISPPPCTSIVPCSFDYLSPYLTGPLGFIKIPFLALVAFTIISIMLGNFALASAEVLPIDGRGQAQARSWTIAIVVGTVVVFGLLTLLV
ncbi:MAG: disulfide bond formation protein B [Oscillochloris sp.]|nr:disulfide bond formation protein B [Oscillochloris sp.]